MKEPMTFATLADMSPHNIIENWINGNQHQVIRSFINHDQPRYRIATLAGFSHYVLTQHQVFIPELIEILRRIEQTWGTL